MLPTTIYFELRTFTAPPVVLVTIISDARVSAIVTNITTESFDVQVRDELRYRRNVSTYSYYPVSISWLAIPEGSGTWNDIRYTAMRVNVTGTANLKSPYSDYNVFSTVDCSTANGTYICNSDYLPMVRANYVVGPTSHDLVLSTHQVGNRCPEVANRTDGKMAQETLGVLFVDMELVKDGDCVFGLMTGRETVEDNVVTYYEYPFVVAPGSPLIVHAQIATAAGQDFGEAAVTELGWTALHFAYRESAACDGDHFQQESVHYMVRGPG